MMIGINPMDWEDFMAKRTTHEKLDVTEMPIDMIGLVSAQLIQKSRDQGWHYSGCFPVDWLLEGGEPKNYMIFIFAK